MSEPQPVASQALAFTVEFTPDEDYEKWHPYDPKDMYRHVFATLKVGSVPVYTTDWMVHNVTPMEQQLESAAAELLTRLWGIQSETTSTGYKDVLPKREYPEKGEYGY